jgi:fumarate reductase subunit C
MHPARPGRTRTAPPQLPDRFPFEGRYLAYTLFDLTGAIYLILGFVVLRVVWALGTGPVAWEALRESLKSPPWIAFHAIALASVCFVGVRFFRLFPKSQPPRIGPAKPPPRPVIFAALYAAWAAISVLMILILGGSLFR